MSHHKFVHHSIILLFAISYSLITRCNGNDEIQTSIKIDGDTMNDIDKLNLLYDSEQMNTAVALDRSYDLMESGISKTGALLANYVLDNVIQPNALTENDLNNLETLITSSETLTVNQILDFMLSPTKIGYTVVIFLSLLLMIAVPIIGLIVCCCRCGGKCGGKVKDRDAKCSTFGRTFCGFFLFIFVVIMISMCVFIFVASFDLQGITNEAKLKPPEILETISNGVERINDYLSNLISDLFDISKSIADSISLLIDQIKTLPETLYEKLDIGGHIGELKDGGNNFTIAGEKLKSISSIIPEDVDVKSDYDAIVNNFDNLSDLSTFLEEITSKYNKSLEDIGNTIDDEIDDTKLQVQNLIKDVDEKIKQVENELPNEFLEEIKDTINGYSEIDYFSYFFYFTISVSSLVALLTLFFLMGMLKGACCRRAFPVNEYSSCTKKQGATWLIIGVAISFILYSMLSLIGLTLVVGGGLFHTDVCRNIVELDSEPINSRLEEYISTSINLELNISNIYTECQKNKSLHDALDLEKTFSFNFTELFDETAIDDIKNTLNLNLLSFPPIISVDLITRAGLFDIELGKIASSANNLADEINTRDPGNNAIETLAEISDKLKNIKFKETLEKIENYESDIIEDANEIITELVDKVFYMTKGVLNDAKHLIKNEVGTCYPLYKSYAHVVDSICVVFLYPFNTFSMCFGLFLFVLLLAMFFGLELSNLYKKTLPYVSKKVDILNNPIYSPTSQDGRRISHTMIAVDNPAYTNDINSSYGRPPPYNGNHH